MKIMKSILGLMTAVLFSLTAAVTTAQAGSVLKIVPHADLKNTDPIWTTAAPRSARSAVPNGPDHAWPKLKTRIPCNGPSLELSGAGVVGRGIHHQKPRVHDLRHPVCDG